MDPSAAVPAIAHLIQLAVAPVFLLAGIGSILNVLAQRLARVGRARPRNLETELESLDPERTQAIGAAEFEACSASG